MSVHIRYLCFFNFFAPGVLFALPDLARVESCEREINGNVRCELHSGQELAH